MSNISLTNIKKRYGSFQAIHDLSLDIDDGEFVVLVGPSGCGKSTLLRMVAGLESVTGGAVRIGDRVVNDLMPRERDIAMVFQSYALYPHMTVAQNMGFSLKLDGCPKPEINERVRAAAAILSLEPLLDRKPSQLSGGQRQRVAMGRAIVRSPQVFLFDEPLSNLDAKLRVQMRAEIKSLHNRLKTTVVYVTHDQVEAMTMADRIVVMNQGHIEQSGTPLDLYDNPANRFVAGFLGSPAMNMIECTLERDDTRDALRLHDGQLLRIGDRRLSAEVGARLIMGIRPEHMRPAEQGGAGLDVRVHLQEPTGSHTLLIGLVGDTSITCEVPDRLELAQDDTVTVAYDPARLHFFDAETSKRLDP